MTETPETIDISITLDAGAVKTAFSRPIETLILTPSQAIELASRLENAAWQARRAAADLKALTKGASMRAIAAATR